MNRRDLILGILTLGAAATPLSAYAQRSKRLGILMGYAQDDPEALLRLAAFKEKLGTLGWAEGRNLTIDIRWTAGDIARAAAFAKELVSLHPDVILTNTTPSTAAVQRETKTIPIVFTIVSDPVGSGFVKTLSRPGGNITGFINLEDSLVQKWLELLKELSPQIARVTVIYNPQTAPYTDYYLRPLNDAAQRMGVKILPVTARSAAEIGDVITALGREAGNGLIVMTDSFMFVHRKLIIERTAHEKIPATYWVGNIPAEGGLVSYGVDYLELFRRAAPYVDRILRGAKPADLPVEQPAKFELVINSKVARALGLTIPPALLLRADRVIE